MNPRYALPIAVAIACYLASGAFAEEGSKTYTVSPGMSIQAVLDKAAPGDTVQVLPGEYVESIRIAKDGVVLRGLEYEGERATLRARDAEEDARLETAVVVEGNTVTVEGFVIDGYSARGVAADDVGDLTLRDLFVRHEGSEAIALGKVRRATMDRVVTMGGTFAGIALENALQVSLRHCGAYDATVGLMIFNSQETDVEASAFARNGTGIVVHGTEIEEAATSSYTRIVRSRMTDNNRPAIAGVDGASSGMGVVLRGALHTEIAECVIAGNGSTGIVTLAHDEGPVRHADRDTNVVGPSTQQSYVHNNRYEGNGTEPSDDFSVRFPGIPPGDLYWDGRGERNQFHESLNLKTYPEKLVVKQGGVHTNVIHFL